MKTETRRVGSPGPGPGSDGWGPALLARAAQALGRVGGGGNDPSQHFCLDRGSQGAHLPAPGGVTCPGGPARAPGRAPDPEPLPSSGAKLSASCSRPSGRGGCAAGRLSPPPALGGTETPGGTGWAVPPTVQPKGLGARETPAPSRVFPETGGRGVGLPGWGSETCQVPAPRQVNTTCAVWAIKNLKTKGFKMTSFRVGGMGLGRPPEPRQGLRSAGGGRQISNSVLRMGSVGRAAGFKRSKRGLQGAGAFLQNPQGCAQSGPSRRGAGDPAPEPPEAPAGCRSDRPGGWTWRP